MLIYGKDLPPGRRYECRTKCARQFDKWQRVRLRAHEGFNFECGKTMVSAAFWEGG